MAFSEEEERMIIDFISKQKEIPAKPPEEKNTEVETLKAELDTLKTLLAKNNQTKTEEEKDKEEKENKKKVSDYIKSL